MKNLDSAIVLMKSVNWFGRVGLIEPVGVGMRVNHLTSWGEALVLRGAVSSTDRFLEARNVLTRELSDRFRADYRKWNHVVAEVHEALEPEIFRDVDAVIDSTSEIHETNNGVAFAKVTVRWDLVNVLMEHAYSDLLPVRFYSQIFRVYQGGHFPCDWDEVWPHGKLWIY